MISSSIRVEMIVRRGDLTLISGTACARVLHHRAVHLETRRHRRVPYGGLRQLPHHPWTCTSAPPPASWTAPAPPPSNRPLWPGDDVRLAAGAGREASLVSFDNANERRVTWKAGAAYAPVPGSSAARLRSRRDAARRVLRKRQRYARSPSALLRTTHAAPCPAPRRPALPPGSAALR